MVIAGIRLQCSQSPVSMDICREVLITRAKARYYEKDFAQVDLNSQTQLVDQLQTLLNGVVPH